MSTSCSPPSDSNGDNSDDSDDGINSDTSGVPQDLEHGGLIIIGCGPGIGLHVASYFARHGFLKIILMSRNIARLSDDVVLIHSIVPDAIVDLVSIDLATSTSVQHALIEADRKLDGVPLECVVYNAWLRGSRSLLDWTPDGFLESMQMAVVSLMITAQWALPQLRLLVNHERCKPLFLVPQRPPLGSAVVRAGRAAQYSVVSSLFDDYGPRGIHCGLIIDTRVKDGDIIACDPQEIAEAAWTLYTQRRDEWTVEIRVSSEGDESV